MPHQKKTNEILSYSFSRIYQVPITNLRLFTIYGPFPRTDMAMYKFVQAAFTNKKIELFNYGNHYRDFTYVDDVTKIIMRLINKPPKNINKYNIFNIGSGKVIKITKLIQLIEKITCKKIKIKNTKFQQGDVLKTQSTTKKIEDFLGNKIRKTSIEIGVDKFVEWFRRNIDD